MDGNKYMLVVLGSAKGIDDSLNYIADSDFGVNYVDGTGIFIATFSSTYTTSEIGELLSAWPAILLFDITNTKDYSVNLPSKYYRGLFPETFMNIVPIVTEDSRTIKNTEVSKDLTNIDDILDKLQANNYNVECLTKKEKEILENGN